MFQDPEIVSVYLMRFVHYFCDHRGIDAIAKCFEQADTDTLPCCIANTLIVLIANVSGTILYIMGFTKFVNNFI